MGEQDSDPPASEALRLIPYSTHMPESCSGTRLVLAQRFHCLIATLTFLFGFQCPNTHWASFLSCPAHPPQWAQQHAPHPSTTKSRSTHRHWVMRCWLHFYYTLQHRLKCCSPPPPNRPALHPKGSNTHRYWVVCRLCQHHHTLQH